MFGLRRAVTSRKRLSKRSHTWMWIPPNQAMNAPSIARWTT
jgi:hypothetical protein